jgi:hypothetical protein
MDIDMNIKYHKKTHRRYKPYFKQKYKSPLCENTMTFQECELAILRHAIDENEKIQSQKVINTKEISKIIHILEEFLQKKKLICYGGTAINNILPSYAQFYNKDLEIPDYDFYSVNALRDAKELADIYHKEGYTEVEAKSGVHHGTYKVYVNFIPIADVTYLDPIIYNSLKRETIQVAGIHYASPNFLRMSMYLELSRPAGDVSRWEKVFKRLSLLNKHYPFHVENSCTDIDFQRKLDKNQELSEKIYIITKNTLVDQGVVFFGGYATLLYSRHLPKNIQKKYQKNPDFDVLSEEIDKTALILKERLIDNDIRNVKIISHEPIGEIIPRHIEVKVGVDTIAFIYEPIACHNYNTVNIDGLHVNVATIDTMLSFYLAFIYVDEFSFFKDRILCMASFLFDVERKNKLKQMGVLRRFTPKCIGKQVSLEDIRAIKTEKFKELATNRKSAEYESWFLKYNPATMENTHNEAPIKTEDTSSHIETSPSTRKNKTKKRAKKEIQLKLQDYFFTK